MVSEMQKSPRRVLIVDQSQDTREVLRTVLRRLGVQTYEAQQGPEGLDLAEQYRPDVTILDMDSIDPSNVSVCDGFARHARQEHTALLLLGNVRQWRGTATASDVVTKPYHYGPLVRKIEALLHQAGTGSDVSSPG